MFCILSKHFNFIASFMIACSECIYTWFYYNVAPNTNKHFLNICLLCLRHHYENYVESQLAGRIIVRCPLECSIAWMMVINNAYVHVTRALNPKSFNMSEEYERYTEKVKHNNFWFCTIFICDDPSKSNILIC